MIKIWTYKSDGPWEESSIDLNPDITLEEFLCHMKVDKDPKVIVGDNYTTVTIFKDNLSNYYISLELQELKEIIIAKNLYDLFQIMKELCPIMLSFADMMRSFGDED